MSIKPRQFTDQKGNTIYVNMSRKEYKAELKKQKEAYEAAKKAGKLNEFRAGTWQPEGYKAKEFDQGSIFTSKKAVLKADMLKSGESKFAGSSLGIADGNVETQKAYETKFEKYYNFLMDEYQKDEKWNTMEPKRLKEIAKSEAEKLVRAEMAADKVIKAEYFTPDQKGTSEYKVAKKNGTAVLLTKDDMKRIEQLDELKEFVETVDGKKVITDQDGLKKAAAELVSDDLRLSYQERFDLTRKAKDLNTYKDANGTPHTDDSGHEGKAISHASARETKNLFKHLGFSYDIDRTDLMYTVSAIEAAAGAAIGFASGSASAVAGSTSESALAGNVSSWVTPAVTAAGVSTTEVILGTLPAALTAAATPLLNKDDPTILEAKIKQSGPPVETGTTVVTETTVEKTVEPEIIGEAHEHKIDPNYSLDTRLVGPSQYVAAVYGVREGSADHKKALKAFYDANPSIRNKVIVLHTKVIMPEVDGLTRDLDKQPAVGTRSGQTGQRSTNTASSSYWLPGQHQNGEDNKTKYGSYDEAAAVDKANKEAERARRKPQPQ